MRVKAITVFVPSLGRIQDRKSASESVDEKNTIPVSFTGILCILALEIFFSKCIESCFEAQSDNFLLYRGGFSS